MLKFYKTSRWLSLHLDLSFCLSTSLFLSVEVYLSISPIQSYLPLRIQVSPEKGISPCKTYSGDGIETHQSYSREGSGFLGYHLFISDVHHVSQRCTNLLKSTGIFPQNASMPHQLVPHVTPELRYFEHLLQCIEVVNVSPEDVRSGPPTGATKKNLGSWICPYESWLLNRDPGILIMV